MKANFSLIQRSLFFLFLVLVQFGIQAQDLADAGPPTTAEELFSAGEKAYRAGDRESAIRYYDRVLEVDPAHLNALLQRGFCHTLQKEYAKAVTDFTGVIAQKKDHTWAYTSRGSAYAKQDKHDLAIADFNKVLQLDPKNEEAFNNRGWSRKATGDMKGACKDWCSSKQMGNAEAKIILKNNRCR